MSLRRVGVPFRDVSFEEIAVITMISGDIGLRCSSEFFLDRIKDLIS